MNSADIKSLSIGEPLWLLLLLLIPIVIWLNGRKKDNQTIKFSSIKNFNITQKSPRLKTIWIPRFIFYLGIILAIVSLSRPRLDQSTQSIISSGVDIVLGVDLSAYETSFFQVIENLMYTLYSETQVNLIHSYIYQVPLSDKAAQPVDKDGKVLVPSTPEELWNAIVILKNK